MTLHNAIFQILREKNSQMKTQEIADEINRRQLYVKRDGSPVTAFQIHGRTRNYPHLFSRDGSLVGLVEWDRKSRQAHNLSQYKDNNENHESLRKDEIIERLWMKGKFKYRGRRFKIDSLGRIHEKDYSLFSTRKGIHKKLSTFSKRELLDMLVNSE